MHSSENSTPNTSIDCPLYQSFVSTPSELTNDEWCYGELDEHEANHLLQSCDAGTFLIRKYGTNRFYISLVDEDNFIKHIPIRQLNSCYFLDGERFDSLRELVSTYKPACFPLKKDNIMAINHSQHEFSNVKYICVKSFERCVHDEISAEVGDVLSVYETDDQMWMMGRNESNGMIGLIPSSHIDQLIVEVDDLNDLPYFYDTISADMVKYNPIGAFLLRRSSKGADTYALLVKTQIDLVEKFLIVGSPTRGFNLAGRPFKTIGHVLNRYCERPISGGVRLTRAVCIKNRKKSTRLEQGKVSWASMSSSQYGETKKQPQKTRRMFRGASIDTALASSSFLSSSNAMPSSPSNTISTGFPEGISERYSDEDYNDQVEASSSIVASTSALRKSREEKQWKECWITLSDVSSGSSQLSIYDSMGSKRRQFIDLSSCTVFCLDDSVFSVDGCLFLSTSYPQQPAIFLCFRPFSAFLKWARMLRMRSIFQDVPPPMSHSTISYSEPISQLSILSIEIEKYRSDILKSDMVYSANVLLNGVKVCSSNSFAPAGNKSSTEMPVVVIDSKFVIPCIPTCNTNIQLSIVGSTSNGKKGRPCGVSVSIPLVDSSESVYQQPPDTGFTFKVTKSRFPVLAIDRYKPLIDAIKESPTTILGWPSQVLPQHYKMFLYSCISYLYALDPTNMSHVFRRIVSDALATSTAEDVFRKDSLATGIVTQCLRHLFKTPFDEFLQDNPVFSQASKTQNNGSNIEQIVEVLVNFVDQKLMTIPLASQLLVVAAECAMKRFGDEPHIVKRTLSALLILRVLNPIIFSTLNSGIGSSVAKLVQSSANAAASRSADDTLTGSAATIRRIFDRMILLVNQKDDSEERMTTNDSEMHTEWLSCISHLIGYSLTLKQSNTSSSTCSSSSNLLTTTSSTVVSSSSSEDIHSNLPLPVLELVRIHQ